MREGAKSLDPKGSSPSYLIIALSGWVSRGVIILAQLINVHLLSSSLGIESYSAISLLLGLQAWFSLLDFGLGTTLQNRVSEARARNEGSFDHILTSSFLALVLMALGSVLVYLLSPLAATLYLCKVTTLSIEQKTFFFTLGGGALCVSSISSVAMKTCFAQRRGYLANGLGALGALLSLLAVWTVARTEVRERAAWAVAASTFPNALVGICCLAWQAGTSRIRGGALRAKIAFGLARSGANVWAFSLLSACVLQLDYVILSQVASAPDVVLYSIVTKLVLVASIIHTSVLQALWPELTELFVSREWPRFFKRLRNAITLGATVLVAWVVLCVAFRSQLLALIAPSLKAEVPATLIILVGIYSIARVWTDTFSTALSSTGNLKPLWRWVPIQAVASVTLLFALAPLWGIWGVVCSLILSFLMTVVWALPLEVRRMCVPPSISTLGK